MKTSHPRRLVFWSARWGLRNKSLTDSEAKQRETTAGTVTRLRLCDCGPCQLLWIGSLTTVLNIECFKKVSYRCKTSIVGSLIECFPYPSYPFTSASGSTVLLINLHIAVSFVPIGWCWLPRNGAANLREVEGRRRGPFHSDLTDAVVPRPITSHFADAKKMVRQLDLMLGHGLQKQICTPKGSGRGPAVKRWTKIAPIQLLLWSLFKLFQLFT